MLYLYHVNHFSYQELKDQLTIGRTSGDLVFGQDGRMSGKHAQITVEPTGEVYVEDLGSKNKTIVNRFEIPANQKLRIKIFALLEVGSQQFILTDKKDLNIQQLNEVMEHHMAKAVVKLEKEVTRSNIIKAPEPVAAVDELAQKEALLLQLQKEVMTLEQNTKQELVRLEEQKEKLLSTAKNKRAELMAKAQSVKDEVEKQKAEAQRIRTELEQKKKKIINLKDLPAEEESTEELPE